MNDDAPGTVSGKQRGLEALDTRGKLVYISAYIFLCVIKYIYRNLKGSAAVYIINTLHLTMQFMIYFLTHVYYSQFA